MPYNHSQPGLWASSNACWQWQQCPYQNLLSCATSSPLLTQVQALFSSPHGESDSFFALAFCYREFQVHIHTHTRKAKQISHVFIAITNILQICFFPTWWPFLWNFLKCKSLILCYFTCKWGLCQGLRKNHNFPDSIILTNLTVTLPIHSTISPIFLLR